MNRGLRNRHISSAAELDSSTRPACEVSVCELLTVHASLCATVTVQVRVFPIPASAGSECDGLAPIMPGPPR